MQNTEATIATLLALKDRGVELSIDDFGTGYSSLAYLQRFPIDKVKIDIAFVRNITGELEQATIAQTIIHMAHSLSLDCIAEGVETKEQQDYLRHHGCDEMQGYLVSRPLPLEEVQSLLMNEQAAMDMELDSNVARGGGSLAAVPSGSTNGSSPSDSIELSRSQLP
jgi:EAL domain-containing protein (putative c-di-GMP-specific phosphodiesterase class I)